MNFNQSRPRATGSEVPRVRCATATTTRACRRCGSTTVCRIASSIPWCRPYCCSSGSCSEE